MQKGFTPHHFHISNFIRVPLFKKSGGGFTLIELLVVLVIIGILASIVLVQFPEAIRRARDGRVVSDMSQFRTQAIILYSIQESYAQVACTVMGTLCDCLDSTIEYLCNDIEQNIVQGDDLVTYVQNNGQGFCAVVHLEGSGRYFCVDGELHAKEYETFPDFCSPFCEVMNNCSCE